MAHHFDSWTHLAEHILEQTGQRPNAPRRGITMWRVHGDRSVLLRFSESDEAYCNTDYWESPTLLHYTLEGRKGDQNIYTATNTYLRWKARRLYLYSFNKKNHVWTWYGEVTRANERPLEEATRATDGGKIYRIVLKV